jgi:hypothetical protein
MMERSYMHTVLPIRAGSAAGTGKTEPAETYETGKGQ